MEEAEDSRMRARVLRAVLVFALGCGGNVVVDGVGTRASGSDAGSAATNGGIVCDDNDSVLEQHTCNAWPATSGLTTCPSGKAVDACPTSGRLGTCAIKNPTGSESVTYYDDYGATADSAQAACAANGNVTWSN
jgi:hypothetical protein